MKKYSGLPSYDYRFEESECLPACHVGLRKSKLPKRRRLNCCCEKMKNYMKKREKRIVYLDQMAHLKRYHVGYFLLYWESWNMSFQEKKLVVNDGKKSTGYSTCRAKHLRYCPWCCEYIGFHQLDRLPLVRSIREWARRERMQKKKDDEEN